MGIDSCHGPGIVLRLALFMSLLAAASCSTSESSPTATAAPAEAAKDPAAARKLIAAGAVVLDVRTPDEYGFGHLDNASNIPVDQLATRLPEVARLTGADTTRPIVVYCASGRRAAKAKRALDQAGYTNVVNGGDLDDLR